jgi:hypothetical protein
LHGLQVWLLQYGSLRSVAHCASLVQGLHSVELGSQIGEVGDAQSVDRAQCPQDPLAVQTSGLMQSSGEAVHALQVCVAGSQMGVLLWQPAFACVGSHTAH